MAAPATGAIQSTTTLPSGPSPSTINLTSEDHPKPTYSSKVGNAKGRLSENTAAAVTAQRQPSTQKAWGSGTNSVNPQGPQNSSVRNGASTQGQGNITGGSSGVLREGLKTRITLDSGVEYEGIYSAASDSSYTLKMVKKVSGSADIPNGTSRSNREQSSMSFPKKDVADIHVTGAALPLREVKPQNGNTSSFRTDGAISGNKIQGERTLQRWVPDESIETDMSLESSNTGGWDQFAANERLFGLQTDYDETIYTTAIDKSRPDYKKRYAEADRKAREIEASVANNRHVAEERITDNLTVDDSGLDEEDKYSGVQKQDFPPLTSSGRPDKYTPPARRAPTGQPTVSGAPVDPAIISSQLARPDKANESNKPSPIAKLAKTEIATPPTTSESSVTPTPELKATPAESSKSASRTASPNTKPVGVPNATATVERDVVSAFKGFAAQQRVQADKLRSSKAKADKEVKLTELKKFAANFKLTSPLPSDLVAIIAKDPAKQREIQEQARRNAEQSEAAKQAKANSGTASPASSASEQKTPQRPSASGASSTSGVPSRQNSSRTGGTFATPQGPYASQSFRADRPPQPQPIPTQQGRNAAPLSARLRNIEQGKNAQLHAAVPGHEARQPPTGPSNSGDQSFSRRSSGPVNMMAKLNPNSHEFRPSPFAASFSPNGNPSTASSPRSNSTSTANHAIPSPSGSLLRKKPAQQSEESSSVAKADIIENLAKQTAPDGKNWAGNGGVKPAYDTIPTWKQLRDDEPQESMMRQTYAKLFENPPFSNQTMSPPQPSHVHPQVPHQHQLPFHLQQGAHMSQRQSPRQPPLHMQNQHGHGPNVPFTGPDEHRMMPSHSAQSYASPRLQQVNMAYPAPMGQSPQLAYNQPGMQYPMGPGAPQMAQYRSFSGGHQFVPPQAAHMGGPVMLQGPAGNAFMGGPGMVTPAPQMIYPVGQPHFVQQGGGPPPVMPGSAGYPSPGRGAPMMMTQGSQQGQQVYGMSPGVQYGQPIYAQQPPGQMPNMRGYPAQGQQPFGTSPQMHQFGQPHRGAPSGGYNKNFQPQTSPHPPAPQAQIPTGPQAQPPSGGDEAK